MLDVCMPVCMVEHAERGNLGVAVTGFHHSTTCLGVWHTAGHRGDALRSSDILMVDSTSLAQNIRFIQIDAFMYIRESRPLSENICTDQEDQVVAAVDNRLTPQNLGFAQLE